MKISMLNNKDKLDLCWRYFLAGFALLPFMWTINAIWFFKEAFIETKYTEQNKIRIYVILSAIGSIAWLIAMSTWYAYFTNHRSEWGILGDSLSFVTPRGVA